MTRPRHGRLGLRLARAEDAEPLVQFRCSSGPWFEFEVEEYVHRHALRRALSTPDTYRFLLAIEQDRLVACAAHHPEALLREDGTLLLTTRLQLLALAAEDQGRRLADGTRLSDTMMEALIADAIETRREDVLTAIVAQDNLRSMALCRRRGLRSEVRYGSRYVRLTGHFTIP